MFGGGRGWVADGSGTGRGRVDRRYNQYRQWFGVFTFVRMNVKSRTK